MKRSFKNHFNYDHNHYLDPDHPTLILFVNSSMYTDASKDLFLCMKIYRPEIYNANHSAESYFKPSLKNQDHSLTKIIYDREERNRLGIEQGLFAEKHFVKPNKDFLKQWLTNALNN